jgi:hypothetical protein
MTPAEIIARAYDREQAAQMGEPDPWADGTDHPEWSGSLACAHEAIAALNAAGYRILAPGERDPVTIEAAAEVTERMLIYADTTSTADKEIAAAIRALEAKG